MVELSGLTVQWFNKEQMLLSLVSTMSCHICGNDFHTDDMFAFLEVKEVYTLRSGRVNRTVQTQWHVGCFNEYVVDRSFH